MKIKNINKYTLKHVGAVLFLVGFVMLILQLSGSNQMFPLNTLILAISLIFQIIGWNEPWFLWITKKGS